MSSKAKIAVTCGDPAGIGPELGARWAEKNSALTEAVLFIGPTRWFESFPALQNFENVAVGPASFALRPGQPDETGARVAIDALELAANGCRAGKFTATVTAPVSKIWMQRAGFHFPGQTEFFEARWGGRAVMGFLGERLRVALATWHIPLRQVAEELEPRAVERAIRAAVDLATLDGVETPRIALCGLNPHAGEEGLLGGEEMEWIAPLAARLRDDFPNLSPPLPGDTVFWRALRGDFDVVVALYHDQGLGPLKTVEFDTAVHLTLGLPWLRTSPDHGTAFELAGKNLARGESFSRAIDLALRASRL